MPLHELPLQKCGTGHWLTEPCPKGQCDLLVFENDTVVLKPSRKTIADRVKSGTISDLAAAATIGLVEVPKSALSSAEKQKRYRERQKAKRVSDE